MPDEKKNDILYLSIQMKQLFIWVIAGLSVCTSLSAQGYGGRYGGGRGGYGGGYRGNRGENSGEMRARQAVSSNDYSQVYITDFPEITGLTLKQNLDLSTAITDEHRNIMKLNDQKQELQVKVDHADSQKQADKNTKKIAKLDDKIQKASLKADKKIRAILSEDQYTEYINKKDLIKFGILPSFRGGGYRPFPPNNNIQEKSAEFNDN